MNAAEARRRSTAVTTCRERGHWPSDGVAKMWSQAFFSSSVRDDWHGVPGLGRDIGGVVLGVDGPTRSDWRVGGVFSAQDSHARGLSSGDRARVRTIQAGLTVAGRWRGIDVSGGAAHGWHAIDSRREVSAGALRDAPRAKYLAGSDQVFLEVSRAFTLALARDGRGPVEAPPRPVPVQGGQEPMLLEPLRAGHGLIDTRRSATTVAPFARFAWVAQRVRGFQEQGRDAALAVDGVRQSLGLATVGVAFSHAIETTKGSAHVHARLGWRHAIGATRSQTSQRFVAGASGRRFTSEGLPVTRNALQLDLAVRAKASRAVTLSLAYAGQFARGATDHGFRLDGAWVF